MHYAQQLPMAMPAGGPAKGGPDSNRTVLQVLFYGVLFAWAREAVARREAAARKVVPGWLRGPVLVAAMPRGWRDRTRAEPYSQTRTARLWFFNFNKSIVEVRRTRGLTLIDAADHIYTHVQSA